MALASRSWVRHRSRLALPSLWHLQQTVSPAGVRITSCARVLAPGDAVDEADRRA